MQDVPASNLHNACEVLMNIRTDFYFFNHALQFEEEMPPGERGTAHYVFLRIIERLDDFIEKTVDELEKIPVA